MTDEVVTHAHVLTTLPPSIRADFTEPPDLSPVILAGYLSPDELRALSHDCATDGHQWVEIRRADDLSTRCLCTRCGADVLLPR